MIEMGEHDLYSLLLRRQSHSRLFRDLHRILLDMRNLICSNSPKVLSHDTTGSRKAFIVFTTTWLSRSAAVDADFILIAGELVGLDFRVQGRFIHPPAVHACPIVDPIALVIVVGAVNFFSIC